MSRESSEVGVWNGLYWRFIGITVVAIAVLQVIAAFAMHYPVVQSLPLALLVVSYLVIPRAKVRRLQNAIIAVIATFVIGVLLELFVDANPMQAAASKIHYTFMTYLESDAFALVLGLVVAFAYLRLTQWSEKKRAQGDAKRAADRAAKEPQQPRRHHNSKNARKKKKHR